MKKHLQLSFTVACCLLLSVVATAQNFGIVLFEDFDAATTPTDWTQVVSPTPPVGATSTVVSDGWAFGEGPYTSTWWTVPASLDASPFAISNDDAADQDRSQDLLMSPVMNLSSYDSVDFLFERFYDGQWGSIAEFWISYDGGDNWLTIPVTADPAWIQDGFRIENNAELLVGQFFAFTDEMMIGFLHNDAGDFASGFAIDNVIVGGYNNPCDDVVTIPACDAPQTVSLGGFGTIDWEFTTGCGFTTFGTEQLYSFTPTVSGVHTLDITATTGNSWIDYMWKPASAGCDTIGWTCLGDVNGVGSYGMNLTAGVEYYILADNEFIDTETQTFEISCPCTYTSLGGTPESESCGADLNGGCNATPEAYEPILCGETISGTLWADGGNRDTDWYQLTVTETTTIEVDYSGGMPINALLIDNCTDLNIVEEATSLACGSGGFSYPVTPGTYILAIVPTAFEAYPCGTANGGNDYDLTVTYCENTTPVEPCLTSESVYNDLNTAGGAPCNDGNGCTPTDPAFSGFGIYGSETYELNNVQAGFDYVFDMCSGFGAGAWIPEIAIVAPDGTTVDAWNGEAATGSTLTFNDNCSISWTATQSGTYSIIINELGTAAGDAPTQVDCNTTLAVDNGNPTVLCGPNEATCLPCEVGTLTSPLEQDVCPGETFDVALSGNSTPGSYSLFFDNSSTNGLGGTGAPVTITGYSQGDFPLAVDEDINGLLSANQLPVLTGTWEVKVIVVDNAGEDCDSTAAFTVNFLDASDPACVTVGIDEANEASVNVYPNPSNGAFTVEINGVESMAQLSVMDLTGRVIYTEAAILNGNFRKELNLNVVSGTYLVQIVTEEGMVTRKLQVK